MKNGYIIKPLLIIITVTAIVRCKNDDNTNIPFTHTVKYEHIILNNSGSAKHHPAGEIWNKQQGCTYYNSGNISFSNYSIRSAFFSAPGIPDFTDELCNELVNKSERIYILYLLHMLSGFSAGGFEPPAKAGFLNIH